MRYAIPNNNAEVEWPGPTMSRSPRVAHASPYTDYGYRAALTPPVHLVPSRTPGSPSPPGSLFLPQEVQDSPSSSKSLLHSRSPSPPYELYNERADLAPPTPLPLQSPMQYESPPPSPLFVPPLQYGSPTPSSRSIASPWRPNPALAPTPAVSPAPSHRSSVYAPSVIQNTPQTRAFSPLFPPSRAPSVAPPLTSDDYNFEDWNVAFEVDCTLYRVHRYLFRRESPTFAEKFDSSPAGQPIPLTGVSCAEFDALLGLLYSVPFEHEPISDEKWISILHVSNMWSMTRIKELAVRHIGALTEVAPVERIVLAAKEAVQDWILPAYAALVERKEPLSIAESRKLISLGEKQVGPVIGMDIVPLLAQARELFRDIPLSEERAGDAKCIVLNVFGYLPEE